MKNPNTASLILIVVMFAVFYLLIIRPQKKRDKAQANMRAALKKGDKVVTIGGIIGTIYFVGEDNVVIMVGKDRVKLEFLKTAIGSVETSKDPEDAGSRSNKSGGKKSEHADDEVEEFKVNRDKKITPKKLGSRKKPEPEIVEEVDEVLEDESNFEADFDVEAQDE